jgi:hypothetical protein
MARVLRAPALTWHCRNGDVTQRNSYGFDEGDTEMRTILTMLVLALTISLFSTASSLAAPVSGAAIIGAAEALAPVQDVRVFCYNRKTGRFKHWGACKRSVPRVYCRSRATGQFLHWGSCNQ